MTDFTPWPKTPRLSKSLMVVTEKIDGTNAAVGFAPDDDLQPVIYAQSRSRLIEPGNDNFGFAQWAYENQAALFEVLGFGLHFGEWWGSGIQRGYGLPKGEKRFSLFNTARFGNCLNDPAFRDALKVPSALHVVPVLGIHTLDTKIAEFNFIAVQGMSGVLVGSPVSLRLGKPLVIVRKDSDTSNHSWSRVENYQAAKGAYVFLDDLISVGTTRNRVVAGLDLYGERTILAGTYEYSHDTYTSYSTTQEKGNSNANES